MKQMLRCVSVALGVSLSAAISGHAFSIGEIKVQSHLNTPFVAEVPLIMQPHERDQEFVAIIGDARDYKAEGVTFVPVIERLRPSIVLESSDIIRIISTEPIEVAAFDLLLLVRTGKVTIVQNFPVALTLDPGLAPIMVETVPPPAPQEKSQTPRVVSPVEDNWLDHLPARYGPILRGEELYKVIVQLGVPQPHIWPVAVRIWEHNQDRFVSGNLHGLRIGSYLEIPQDLRHSWPTLSSREAQQMVAVQWDTWQKRTQIVFSPAETKTAGVGQTAEVALAKPAAQASESMDFASEMDSSSPVSIATLESMLQGFERRLTQRLSLPNPTAEATDEQAITFVSTDDLQTAMRGLEERLILQLETGQRPAGAWRSDVDSKQPSLRVDMETALASFLPVDSLVYVLIVETMLLLAIAAKMSWRWYRKLPGSG